MSEEERNIPPILARELALEIPIPIAITSQFITSKF